MKKNIWPIVGIAASSLVILASGIGFTYAWFSGNRLVNSSTVSGSSGSAELRLQISSTGGADFKADDKAELIQVNKTDLEFLMPVSTVNLKDFVYATGSDGNNAIAFSPVENEANYYHGRVYLRAIADGQPSGTKMALYLNEDAAQGGKLVSNASEELLNAARLGIAVTGNTTETFIFSLSDGHNRAELQNYNTVINGTTLGDGYVLDWQDNKAVPAIDPAVKISDYSLSPDDGNAALPERPLTYMELGQIYSVDIYFYLEGCDPDCSDAVRFEQSDLHLGFYGVLANE